MITTAERFWSKVNKTKSCWLWKTGKSAHGYGSFSVDGKEILAHRYSWKLHCGTIPKILCVLHTCDTPLCVRPKHLFLGTKGDNNRDRHQKGRSNAAHGEKHPNSKLTTTIVKQIRVQYKTGLYSTRQLANEYKVSQPLIHGIVTGTRWSSIK